MMPLGIHLTVHARAALERRFDPPDPEAFALELLTESVLVGYDRRGHSVYQGPRSITVVAVNAHRLDAVSIVTVMPPGWPWDQLGGDYVNLGDLAPAAPASLRALAARFPSSRVSVRRTRSRGGTS